MPNNKKNPARKPDPAKRKGRAEISPEAAVLIASTLVSVAGTRSDDLLTVVLCLAGAAGGYIFLCVRKIRVKAWRVLSIAGIALVLAVLSARGFHRSTAAKRSDVANHLDVTMGAVEPGARAYVMYTIRNNSQSTINKHRVVCIVNKFMDNKRSAVVIAPAGEQGRWVTQPIKAGGDGHTGRCFFTDVIALNGPVVCADISLRVEYEGDIWPRKMEQKTLRFVAAESSGHRWYQMSPDVPGNYCDGAAR